MSRFTGGILTPWHCWNLINSTHGNFFLRTCPHCSPVHAFTCEATKSRTQRGSWYEPMHREKVEAAAFFFNAQGRPREVQDVNAGFDSCSVAVLCCFWHGS